MLTKTSFAAALFATAAIAQNVLRTEDVLSTPYASLLGFSDDTMEVARGLSSKATTNSSIPSDVHLLPDGSLDFTAWNNITSAACQARLSQLTRTSNPSGDCICYNLPMLNVDTGMFEADLRLYRVSAPRDSFVGVPPSGIQVGVSYKGASVSPMKPVTSGSSSPAVNITKRSDGSSGPTLLQSYMLVGQIDKDQMKNNLSIAALQALVMPTLTLSAVTPGGSQISSNVSLNEASFLVGVFSNDVVLSDFAAAQQAVAVQQAALKNGTIAFILPGVNLLIFPTGLIVTCVWLFIGLLAYGFGTYQRIQYATAFKRRAMHASKGDSAYRTL
ncbi:hypothetical protein ACSS6W_006187 [Trichoderma asperelloides]|uniref:Uncharacterized protein n=1 Tax=Trichoderma asperellum TaxID=101201 RepID=A0A6V8QTR7_TRIAP|nr:hypothetical protein LI328DRAFT_123907 [Trichoderma asperelloides]GFP55987.1 hypothetical protein TASIC1_0006015700 [Trichoderma asperellum]